MTPSGRRRSGKAADVIAILERRLRGGDYLVAPLPSGRELAAELGVSYVTARKAVLALQERGLLERGPTGRLALAGKRGGGQVAQLAFLAPSFPSLDVMYWRSAIDRLTAGEPCVVKSHFFTHWDDPALRDIIGRSDGAFLYPSSERLPPALERDLRERDRRLVVVDQDWSALGLPSLCMSPAVFVRAMLDHCRERGHQRIACLNTQPHDHAITGRLGEYRRWAADHGMEQLLIDDPVQPGQDPLPQARTAMARILDAGRPAFSALFVTTSSVALMAMRALNAAGLAPGRDIAVCTLNDGGLGELVIPSLTAQAPVDAGPYLKRALDWMLHPERAWRGPLLVQPKACVVAERESTGALG